MGSEVLALTIAGAGTGLAAVIDLRTRRVPNALTATLAAVGIGIAAAELGTVGLGGALMGCALGLLFMLPGHLFGGTGAGDVKLFAAAGALLGPSTTVTAFLFTAIIGGVLAVAIAIRRRRLVHTIGATSKLVSSPAAGAAAVEATGTDNRFAYAPAIALGVMASLLLSI